MSAPLRVTGPSSADTPSHAASLLIVVVGRGDRVRLSAVGAFRGEAEVAKVDSVRDALALLSQRPVHAMFVETMDEDGTRTAALVEEVRRRFPRTGVIACLSDRRTMSESNLSLVRAGAHDVVPLEELQYRHTLRSLVAASRLSCVADVVWPELSLQLDPAIAPYVRLALRECLRPFDVGRCAAALGIHRKTLWERFRRRKIQSPRNLLGWCRVLAVAFALEERGRSADSIANELDFPSPSAMRNMLQRYLGLTPTALREAGATQLVVGRLAALLAESTAVKLG